MCSSTTKPTNGSTSLLKHFGREKGLSLRNLAKQDLRMVRGDRARVSCWRQANDLLAIVLSGHTVWELKTKEGGFGRGHFGS